MLPPGPGSGYFGYLEGGSMSEKRDAIAAEWAAVREAEKQAEREADKQADRNADGAGWPSWRHAPTSNTTG